jgi:tetratricopeptide (TPR) repeat protein
MATSEIEKLERRYAENPQGLTFAPLAEVHRKNGDVARALELLQAGLELHPNYIPASIVLGRCHWDQGDLPAAEGAFAHVLRLDDENVIALKSLADINERLERFGEAKRWLHRLVSVDRSNEEARQQLTRLETAKGGETGLPHEITAAEPSAASGPPPPVTATAPRPGSPADSEPRDLTAAIAEPPPPSASAEPRKAPEPKPVVIEFLDTSQPVQKSVEATLPTDTARPRGPEETAPLPGLISQEFEPPKESTYRLHPELAQQFEAPREPPRFDVETTPDVELHSSGASEFRVPNAAEDFMEVATRMNAPTTTPERAGVPPGPQVQPPIPAAQEPGLTESMAEVLMQQGKAADALRLPARRPFYSASDTKGQSVASFFTALLAARPLGNSSSPVTPSPPVEGAAREETSAGPPAAPAPGPTKDGAVSFDDFFGPAGGSSPMPPGSVDPDNDDLDQFQSWLQNLKR